MQDSESPRPSTGLEIAIIGMAGRFPGADSPAELWQNLRQGVESISFFSDEELLASRVDPAALRDPRYVRAAGVLEGADLFDAEFFGYSPREAEAIDPQQRIFLECAWEALEDSGYDPRAYQGLIGVYGGTARSTYIANLLSRPGIVRALGVQQIAIAHDKDFLCSRVAYKLGLEGPGVVVQSACSTSLVAVHMACQALLCGECDLALAGGISVTFPQKVGYLYEKRGVSSPDGHCRAFDARAQGTVGGQGVGLVVLKRLASAREDGDCIRAVIKGSAVNSDGALRAGFTAPRVDGQAGVILAAQLAAEVEPDTITYIETHGTGTEVGDPIEVAALTRAFRTRTERKGFCALGSIKTNIGHLDAAAGVAGLVKTVLALENGELPPSLHFGTPNPEIDFVNSPFYVNTKLSPWPAGSMPRRAGVSSFGLGGTNAHVVLEQAPPVEASPRSRPWHLLVLSARTAPALDTATARLAEHLRRHPDLVLADVAYTWQAGRRRFEHRRTLVCRSREDALRVLEGSDAARLTGMVQPRESPSIAFLFPGLGDHYVDMALGLYQGEPRFRNEIDRCAELARPLLGLDLLDALYPGRSRQSGDAAADEAASSTATLDLRALLGRSGAGGANPLHRTSLAHPALFVVEYSLARLWMSWGIDPQAMIGYSLGEYVAACLAGVLSLQDALKLVIRRAQLIEELPAGAMLAVSLSEEQLGRYLGESLSLAAVNGPALCVVAGLPDEISGLEQRLGEEQVLCRRLQTAHAFHSRRLEPVADRFRELVSSLELRAPEIPYLSNVTGTWITASEATNPAYWVEHLLHTVRFAEGLRELAKEPGRVLLEVGPGQSLGSMVLQQARHGAGSEEVVLSSLRHEYDRQSDQAFLLRALGLLWLAGAQVDWASFHEGERRHRVPLPTYPFERQRYWIERQEPVAAAGKTGDPLARIPDPADWFWVPSWKRSARPLPASLQAPQGPCLILADALGLGLRLAERLKSLGGGAVVALAGTAFTQLGEGCYEIAPEDPGSHGALLQDMEECPRTIVHLWSLTPAEDERGVAFMEAQKKGFHSLLALSQALARRGATGRVDVCVVTNGLCGVERGDAIRPAKATLLGPVRVIPQEHPDIRCRVVDVDVREAGAGLVERLVRELADPDQEPVVAWRGTYRWSPTLEAMRLDPIPAGGIPPGLREGGVYLITGGLGGLGLALAELLARTARARLALIGRSALPDRSEWPRYGADDAGGPGARIRRVEGLEAAGSEVLVLSADVADEAQMRRAVEQIRERFGRIDGVFHAAGLPGGGMVQLKTREAAEQVMAPKTMGTLVLHSILKDTPPDFLILFSSIAGLAGEIGQVDYCAANAFLDACAQRNAAHGGIPAVAIDWCEWLWDAWTEASPIDPRIQTALAQQRQTYGLSFEEGMGALWRILASGLPQVAVSTRDLSSMLAQRHGLAELMDHLDKTPAPQVPRHPRPVLGAPYTAPRDETEGMLVGIWQELLGLQLVGIHDNFFDLGGHSLLGLRLISRVRELLHAELTLRTLFEAPTIAELAAAIGAGAGGSAPEPGIEPIPASMKEALEGLDHLSDQQLDALLVQMLSERENGVL